MSGKQSAQREYSKVNVRNGGVNHHPSLLPAYRGADPLTWQVIDQVKYLGVSLHRLIERYDAGPVQAQHKELRPAGAHRQELIQRLEGDWFPYSTSPAMTSYILPHADGSGKRV